MNVDLDFEKNYIFGFFLIKCQYISEKLIKN